jgi:hypothetical protein
LPTLSGSSDAPILLSPKCGAAGHPPHHQGPAPWNSTTLSGLLPRMRIRRARGPSATARCPEVSSKPADSLQPPGGNPPRLTVSPNQADRLAEAGNIGGDAAFSVLGYKLWIWITPGSGEASSGLITGRCKLSQPIPMIFTACMETLQSLSNFVILQCILNPVFLGCLLALGPKGIPCRCRRLGGNHSLLLIRHVFAHCRVVGDLKSACHSAVRYKYSRDRR